MSALVVKSWCRELWISRHWRSAACGHPRVLSGREEVHRLGDPVRVETTGLEARRLLSKLHFRPGRVQR